MAVLSGIIIPDQSTSVEYSSMSIPLTYICINSTYNNSSNYNISNYNISDKNNSDISHNNKNYIIIDRNSDNNINSNNKKISIRYLVKQMCHFDFVSQ